MSAQTELIYANLKARRDDVFKPKKGDQLSLFKADDVVQNSWEPKIEDMGMME